MVTLNRIFENLRSIGIKELIVADSAKYYLSEKGKDSFKCSFIDDVRSAGFFALGKAQTLQQSVALLVESKYISHLYTSMVETWFQKMPVAIIALDSSDDVDYGLYTRCVKQVKDYINEKNFDDLPIANDGPTLLIVHKDKDMQTVSISSVEDLLPKEVQIYKPVDKYGAISKYVGYLCGTDRKVCCVIPLNWVKFDLNIFNNRYIDKRFKLVLRGEMSEVPCKLESWLASNQIELIDGSEGGIEEFLQNNKPSVIIIK